MIHTMLRGTVAMTKEQIGLLLPLEAQSTLKIGYKILTQSRHPMVDAAVAKSIKDFIEFMRILQTTCWLALIHYTLTIRLQPYQFLAIHLELLKRH